MVAAVSTRLPSGFAQFGFASNLYVEPSSSRNWAIPALLVLAPVIHSLPRNTTTHALATPEQVAPESSLSHTRIATLGVGNESWLLLPEDQRLLELAAHVPLDCDFDSQT